jgi:hypothetical protein
MPKKKQQKRKEGRVKNATKNTYKGIEFKSRLETYCYKQLIENNIEAEYEKEKIILIEPFRFKGKAIRKTTYTPDFTGKDFIIECKGYFTEVAKLKWKLFLRWLNDNNLEHYDIYLPRNQKQVDEVIEQILEKNEIR